jgi:hypothetical protein
VTRGLLFVMVAAWPFGCPDRNCAPPTAADLVPGTYTITTSNDPNLVGGTITLSGDTLTVNFQRSAGPVEVVYSIGEQTY